MLQRVGSKQRIAHKIIKHFPEHENLVNENNRNTITNKPN